MKSALGAILALACLIGAYFGAAWILGLMTDDVSWWHYALGLVVTLFVLMMLLVVGESNIEKGLHLVMTLGLYWGIWSAADGDAAILLVALGLPCATLLQFLLLFVRR